MWRPSLRENRSGDLAQLDDREMLSFLDVAHRESQVVAAGPRRRGRCGQWVVAPTVAVLPSSLVVFHEGLWQSDCVPDDGVQAGALGSETLEGAEQREAPRRRHQRRRIPGRCQERGRLIIHKASDSRKRATVAPRAPVRELLAELSTAPGTKETPMLGEPTPTAGSIIPIRCTAEPRREIRAWISKS